MRYEQCGERAKEIFVKGGQDGGKPHTLSSLSRVLKEEGTPVPVKTLSKWERDGDWEGRRREYLNLKRQIGECEDKIDGLEKLMLKGLIPIRDAIEQKINERSPKLPPDPEDVRQLKDVNEQILKLLGVVRAQDGAARVEKITLFPEFLQEFINFLRTRGADGTAGLNALAPVVPDFTEHVKAKYVSA